MAVRMLAAIAIVALGGMLDVPIASLLGVVLLTLEGVHLAWHRRGLATVRYARTLAGHRTPFGDAIPLTVEAWNRSRLPMAWLRAEDETSPGVVVRERAVVTEEAVAGGSLRNAWTLRPFERVRRTFHVGADHRGVFTLGPVTLSAGDPFGREVAVDERPGVDRFLVWPRTLAVAEVAAPDRWGTLSRARAGLLDDPSRFAGTRPYAPGDPLRRVHARTSARIGRPVTKRFEPSRDREVLIAIDVQVGDGRAWEWTVGDDEVVESLYVVAASLARSLAERRVAFGLVAAGYTGAESLFASVATSAAPGQLERTLDLLARLSTHASASFEALLAVAARRVSPGTSVLVLTARDPRPFIASFRRLRRLGADVTVIATGPRADRNVAVARAAGLTARRAQLDGSWRTAESLVVAP